jgi:SAM-dependent methyltransferase
MAKTQCFDDHIDQYEQWFKDYSWVYKSELKALSSLNLSQSQGIEIGTGTGLFSQPLGIKWGVEPSARMINYAKIRGVEPIRGIAEQLPLKSMTFDLVLLVTVVCFFDDIRAAFKECRRILKPWGRIVVGFVDADSPLGKVYQQLKNENVFYRLAEFQSVDSITRIMNDTGFKVVSVRQTVFGELNQIKEIQEYKPGHGEGGFAVIEAKLI